jgi:hypothetical protein
VTDSGIALRKLANGGHTWEVSVGADSSTYTDLMDAVKTAQEIDLHLQHEYPDPESAPTPDPEAEPYRPGKAARSK